MTGTRRAALQGVSSGGVPAEGPVSPAVTAAAAVAHPQPPPRQQQLATLGAAPAGKAAAARTHSSRDSSSVLQGVLMGWTPRCLLL
jgi:hypothetical protein